MQNTVSTWTRLAMLLKENHDLYYETIFKAFSFLAGCLIMVTLNSVKECGSCTITYWCGPDALFQTNKSCFPFVASQINLSKRLHAPVYHLHNLHMDNCGFLILCFLPSQPSQSLLIICGHFPQVYQRVSDTSLLLHCSPLELSTYYRFFQKFLLMLFSTEDYSELFSCYATLVTKARKNP